MIHIIRADIAPRCKVRIKFWAPSKIADSATAKSSASGLPAIARGREAGRAPVGMCGRGWRRRAVQIALLVALVAVCAAEDDLQTMSSAELATLEKRLLKEVEDSDRSLGDLQKETEKLKLEQRAIDEEAEKLMGAKEWEAQEKAKRDKQLEAAKSDVQLKQESISKMSLRVNQLRGQIGTLESRLKTLSKEKDITERRYHDPSLVDVVNSRSQGWSTVSRNVYNKTMTDLVPVLSDMSKTASEYRRRVSKTSRALELAASALLYAFLVAAALTLRKIYTKVRGKLTISRLLFLGDAFCACFWALILFCFCLVLDDPLYVIKQRSPTPFFAFQLIACFCYVNFVLLRVLVLASKMTLGALGETLSVVVVGHHYYVRVWQPAILDKPFHGTFFYYFCYAWLFSAFAYNRVQEFAPLKQLRGPKLPPLMWLRVLFARFTAGGVPDGDIESTAYGSDSGESDDDHRR